MMRAGEGRKERKDGKGEEEVGLRRRTGRGGRKDLKTGGRRAL